MRQIGIDIASAKLKNISNKATRTPTSPNDVNFSMVSGVRINKALILIHHNHTQSPIRKIPKFHILRHFTDC
uniref:Transposase n=1 Tax=Strongyloides venezuelensis TaxID=75913 RepID=A0A0K0G5G1_STRVS